MQKLMYSKGKVKIAAKGVIGRLIVVIKKGKETRYLSCSSH